MRPDDQEPEESRPRSEDRRERVPPDLQVRIGTLQANEQIVSAFWKEWKLQQGPLISLRADIETALVALRVHTESAARARDLGDYDAAYASVEAGERAYRDLEIARRRLRG